MSNICYKATSENYVTRNHMKWGKNVTHRIHPSNYTNTLCTGGWIHVYPSPEIASIMLYVHASHYLPHKDGVLWLAKGGGKYLINDDLKQGYTNVTTIKKIAWPEITYRQCKEIYCRMVLASHVYGITDVLRKCAKNYLGKKKCPLFPDDNSTNYSFRGREFFLVDPYDVNTKLVISKLINENVFDISYHELLSIFNKVFKK